MFCMPWQENILQCAKIALVKQTPSGLENTCKNNCITSPDQIGFLGDTGCSVIEAEGGFDLIHAPCVWHTLIILTQSPLATAC